MAVADEKAIGLDGQHTPPSPGSEHGQPPVGGPGAGGVLGGSLGDGGVGGVGLSNAAVRETYGETKRGLSPRHVQLMALGGSVGVGIWVGIGGVLMRAGPLSLLLGYIFWGILFVLPLQLCVAEMVAYLPIRGSIFELAARYVDPALGFAMGWTYFIAGFFLLCTEYSAVATLMQYWEPDLNPAIWIVMAMVVCITLNVAAVRWYGESEFIMASTKIVLLFMLVAITIVTMAGGNPQRDAYGFRNWQTAGLMHEYHGTGSWGRFLGFLSVVFYASFNIAGPDLIAIAAGEMRNPRHTIPRVARLVFYRILGFYILGVLGVSIICSSRDPGLEAAIDGGLVGAGASPWVIGIQNLGISGLPDLINALIVLSAWSCGNAFLYSSSRCLYGLARDGQAPRFLLKCTASGVPIYAVGVVCVLSCITFLVASNSAVDVFYWFVDLTTTALVTTYSMMLIVFIGWHRAKKAQNFDESVLHYRAPWTPYTAFFALALGIIVLLIIGFDTFSPFNTRGFITSYFASAFGVCTFVFWKVLKRTSFVKPEEADLISGKAEIDEECKRWEDGGVQENEKARLAAMNPARRAWEKLW